MQEGTVLGSVVEVYIVEPPKEHSGTADTAALVKHWRTRSTRAREETAV